MLTQYFPQTLQLKSGLEGMIKEEMELRAALALKNPESVDLSLFLEQSCYYASTSTLIVKPRIHLNIVYILFNRDVEEDYVREIQFFDQWVAAVRPIVAPETHRILDNRLIEAIINPLIIRDYDLEKIPKQMADYIRENSERIVHEAPRVMSFLEELINNRLGLPIEVYRTHMKHELEHCNPEYYGACNECENAQVDFWRDYSLYYAGSRHLTDDQISSKADWILEQSRKIYPDEEVRAFFCQFYGPGDIPAKIKEIASYTSAKIMSCHMKVNFTNIILATVIRKHYMLNANHGDELTEDTAFYVQNIVCQGNGQDQRPIQMGSVDPVKANAMMQEIGYHLLRFQEEIMRSVNRWSEFYLSKVN
ncbi:MAG: hypothetical protein KJ601_03440 [Nanoarchaeota archaeon]|nr:hypothetical protein [Nanoarchaeota archaeon]MBU1704177.1 hypothetical protein [Nanoarchaeota archaeon]